MVSINKTINNVQLIDDKGNIIDMQYGGADFYWIRTNYYENNVFIISSEDEKLFYKMNELFKQISKCDDPYNKVLNNNYFEWISEEYGLPEEAHKLKIKRNVDNYEISFYNNPNRFFGSKDKCYICFCLSGSRNNGVAFAFSNMFLELNEGVIYEKRKKF